MSPPTQDIPVSHKKLKKSISGSIRKKSINHQAPLILGTAKAVGMLNSDLGEEAPLRIEKHDKPEGWKRRLRISLGANSIEELPLSPTPPLPATSLKASASQLSLASSHSPSLSNSKTSFTSRRRSRSSVDMLNEVTTLTPPLPSTSTSIVKMPTISFPDAIASNEVQRISGSAGANTKKKKVPVEVLEIRSFSPNFTDSDTEVLQSKREGFELGMTIDSHKARFPVPPSSIERSMSVVDTRELDKARKSMGTAGSVYSWSELTMTTSRPSSSMPHSPVSTTHSFNTKAFAILTSIPHGKTTNEEDQLDDPSRFFGHPRIESQRASFNFASPSSRGTLSPSSVTSSPPGTGNNDNDLLGSPGSSTGKRIRRKMPPAAVLGSSIVNDPKRRSAVPSTSSSFEGEAMSRSTSGMSDLKVVTEDPEVVERSILALERKNSPFTNHFSKPTDAGSPVRTGTSSSVSPISPRSTFNLLPTLHQSAPSSSTGPNTPTSTRSQSTINVVSTFQNQSSDAPPDIFDLLPNALKRLDGQRSLAPIVRKSASVSGFNNFTSKEYESLQPDGPTMRGLGGIDAAPQSLKTSGNVMKHNASVTINSGGLKKENKLIGSIRNAVGRRKKSATLSSNMGGSGTKNIRSSFEVNIGTVKKELSEPDEDELDKLLSGFERAAARMDTQRAVVPSYSNSSVKKKSLHTQSPAAKSDTTLEKKRIVGKRLEDMDIEEVEEGEDEDEDDEEGDERKKVTEKLEVDDEDVHGRRVDVSSVCTNPLLAPPPRSSSVKITASVEESTNPSDQMTTKLASFTISGPSNLSTHTNIHPRLLTPTTNDRKGHRISKSYTFGRSNTETVVIEPDELSGSPSRSRTMSVGDTRNDDNEETYAEDDEDYVQTVGVPPTISPFQNHCDVCGQQIESEIGGSDGSYLPIDPFPLPIPLPTPSSSPFLMSILTPSGMHWNHTTAVPHGLLERISDYKAFRANSHFIHGKGKGRPASVDIESKDTEVQLIQIDDEGDDADEGDSSLFETTTVTPVLATQNSMTVMDDLLSLDSHDFSYPSLLPLTALTSTSLFSNTSAINGSQNNALKDLFDRRRRTMLAKLGAEDIILKLVEADRRLFEAVSLFIAVEASNASPVVSARGRRASTSYPSSPLASEDVSNGMQRQHSLGVSTRQTSLSLGNMLNLRRPAQVSEGEDIHSRRRWSNALYAIFHPSPALPQPPPNGMIESSERQFIDESVVQQLITQIHRSQDDLLQSFSDILGFIGQASRLEFIRERGPRPYVEKLVILVQAIANGLNIDSLISGLDETKNSEDEGSPRRPRSSSNARSLSATKKMDKHPSSTNADPAVESLAKDVCARLEAIRDAARNWVIFKEGHTVEVKRDSWEILNLATPDFQEDPSSRRLSGFSRKVWESISGARSASLNTSSTSVAALDLGNTTQFSPSVNSHIRRQASLSLDDLPSSRTVSSARISAKNNELDNLEALVAAVEAFDEAYVTFARLVVERHSAVKAIRRQRRFERRNIKLRQGLSHFGAADMDIPSDSSSVMSTRDLVHATLALAVETGWISTDEIETCDPQVFVILPRLTLLVGVFHATFPADWDHGTHDDKECDVYFVFLPRVCRGFLKSDVRVLKSLDTIDRSNLALLLGGKEPKTEPSAEVVTLFKIIGSLADRASQGGKGVSGWIRIMQKVIKARNGLSIAGEEEEDIESVAKELMDAAVKVQALRN